VIWKDNRIQTNQANPVVPGNKAANNRKNAKNRNVNANSANARNKAGVVARSAVAVSQADDKPDILEQEAAGAELPPLCCARTAQNRKGFFCARLLYAKKRKMIISSDAEAT
jgi:hypothetical protein